MKRSVLLVAGFALILFTPISGFAQFPSSSGENWSNHISSALGGGMTPNKTFSGGSLREASEKQRTKRPAVRRAARRPVAKANLSGGFFRPIPNSGVDRELANSLSQKPDERQALLLIFREVKKSYDAEAAKIGQANNVAGALTFFIASCVTAFNDAPEPSELATENLLAAINELAVATPALSRASDREKQLMNDRLIYVGGLILAGYLNGKQTNDADSTMQFRLLAGIALQAALNLEPQKLRFDETGLVVDP